MKNLRQNIANVSTSWLGTKFKHQGRMKHVGCDCIGLIIGVLSELDFTINGELINRLDNKTYAKTPKNHLLERSLDNIFKPINLVQIGDIILMRFHREPQHVGFISRINGNGIYIIHAYQKIGSVIEHKITENWQDKIVKIYDVTSPIK